ncbi:hypothetical protein EVAR_64765_1 [Eumeta japonica]|uniref:Uncharacterized protein n=1 Tax=Eumeta variegata TaxID=151549 RepID=A0A4C1ZFS9_EUMVA|nr:hypothetical protein EVAR_64765_1 [Eumeta japonica]
MPMHGTLGELQKSQVMLVAIMTMLMSLALNFGPGPVRSVTFPALYSTVRLAFNFHIATGQGSDSNEVG